ncbi:MAG TPA: type I pantothenate kinase [Deltaproteobacteria bacterium]|nr:type I pantothenate kinase [Deltaproteobacteria bacterium]
MDPSPWRTFDRRAWSALRADTPMTLDRADVEELRGLNIPLDLSEIEAVYLPLTRLLNLWARGLGHMHQTTSRFLGEDGPRLPFVIGLAGSVAVGKSTFARVLCTLLARWQDHRRVALVTTDGFLWPNAELQRRGLMERKGFPESYDRTALLAFVSDLKSGRSSVEHPVYSHHLYDVVQDQVEVIERSDIVIVEGLNVLQSGTGTAFVSDFFDFSIYLDAELADLRRWYIERFRKLRDTTFRDTDNYFHRYSAMSDEEIDTHALSIWTRINERNLIENIAPTRERATLILKKGSDHRVREVRLRRS